MKDAYTLLLGDPTQRVLTTIPSVIMGGLAWLKGGLFLTIRGLDCISDQDSVLMEIVLLTTMESFMGGLPFIIGMSPPSSSHAMVFQLLLT
jgi:hypothetical protein